MRIVFETGYFPMQKVTWAILSGFQKNKYRDSIILQLNFQLLR